MSFTDAELAEFRQQFDIFDVDKNGSITALELQSVLKAVGEHVTTNEARDMIKAVDLDNNGTIEFREFIEVLDNYRKKKISAGGTAFVNVVKKTAAHVHKLGGYSLGSADTTHSYSEEEKVAFVDWISDCLRKDPDLKDKFPMKSDDDSLFKACHDGILLCKLINDAVPETIDERVINKQKLNPFRITENQVLCINSAKAIGCNVVNIGAQDLIEGRPYLIMGLIWQIIKIGLFAKINLTHHPELYRLLEEGETIEDLLKLPIEEILLRWFNYHLKAAGHNRRIKNFHNDIKDSEGYTILLHQIAPKGSGVDKNALNESNMEKRAGMVLDNAAKIDCRKFLRPRDIVTGNAKLNLAFVANLFNTHPALEPVPEVTIIEETREEKTFRNWMNSLGVEPFVNNLYEDLRDGLVLIQLFDKVSPGIVDHKKVNYPPWKAKGSEMKWIENCNYAVNLGKQLKFSMVNIGGKDIFDKNKVLTLGVVWQLMRAHVISILQSLSGSDKPISDQEIITWANNKLSAAGKKSTISGWKDSRLATAVPIVDLVDAVKPGLADYSLLGEDNLKNAKYAISLARKAGAVIFALPEDIVEVKPKMMLTVVAGLMAVDYGVSK